MSQPSYPEMLAALPAALCSGWFGVLWTRELLANREEPELPAWVRDLLPLKGRWLRLLLTAPGMALVMLVLFAGSYPFFAVMFLLVAGVVAHN